MDERESAVVLANRLLDVPYADPDDDLRILARQLLRRHEEITRLRADIESLKAYCGAYASGWRSPFDPVRTA